MKIRFRAPIGRCLLWALPTVVLSTACPLRAGEVGLVDGLWVMRRSEERYQGHERREDLTITVHEEHRPEVRRVMEVLWLEKDYGKDEKIVVHFLSPPNSAGINLLMHVQPFKDDDRWLYFPAEKVFRRIKARDKYSTFMGTDFTYDDLADHEPEEEVHRLQGIEEYNGWTCYVVESKPKVLEEEGYSRKVTWIEKDHFVKVKIDYWDEWGRHLKTYTADKMVNVDDAWFPTVLKMRSDRARVTTVEREGIRINLGLKDDLFQPYNLDKYPYGNF